MSAFWWLLRRELLARPRAALTAGLVVALGTSVAAAVELGAVAQVEEVARSLDRMGPSAHLVPSDATAGDLARGALGPAAPFDEARIREVKRTLGRDVRAVEGRRLQRLPVAGEERIVVAVQPDRVVEAPNLKGLGPGEAAVGALAAEDMGLSEGDPLALAGNTVRVAVVLPETATASDLVVYATFTTLGLEARFNELRIHARPEVKTDRLAAALAAPDSRLVWGERGGESERAIGSGLSGFRRLLQGLTGLLALVAIGAVSAMNAADRRQEIASLVAIGWAPHRVGALVLARGALVATGGSVAGWLGAVGWLLVSHPHMAGVATRPGLPGALLALAAAVGVLAALPAAWASARREQVKLLQA